MAMRKHSLALPLAAVILACVPSAAVATGLPTVETKPASAIAQTTATLNGSVNPNGVEVTKCEFEYGTTTSYGQKAACVPAKPGSGASPVPVSAALTGLAENTTYHFRLLAENANGKGEGLDATFKTEPPKPLPTVETKAANPVGTTTATLNGSVNPNGVEVTKCEFEYGTT